MGTWSASILGNDTSCEVHERFLKLYDLGDEPEDIADVVLEELKEILQYDKTNFWFGLALAAWECKVLTEEIYNQVKQIVDSKADIEFSKELNANNEFIIKRQMVLDNFVIKISTKKEKARARKKHPQKVESIYSSGKCFTYKNKEGEYIGIYVINAEHFKNKGKITFCFMEFESDKIPNVSMFNDSRIPGLTKLGSEWSGYHYELNVTEFAYDKNTKNDFNDFCGKSLIQVCQLKQVDNKKLILTNPYKYTMQMNLHDSTKTIETLEIIRLDYKLSEMTLGNLIEEFGIN